MSKNDIADDFKKTYFSINDHNKNCSKVQLITFFAFYGNYLAAHTRSFHSIRHSFLLMTFQASTTIGVIRLKQAVWAPAGLLSCCRHRYRCGRSGIRFLGRSNRTQSRQRLATGETFLRSGVAQALCRGIGPLHPLYDLS